MAGMKPLVRAALGLVLVIPLFLAPGISLLRDLADPALAGPGIPGRAVRMHASMSPKLEAWARERVRSGAAAHAALHDVPTTEWPMFTAVFYLQGTESLQRAWERGELGSGPSPVSTSRGAIEASKALLLDPTHHTWVRTHWGDDYLHTQNVFFRSLLVAGLTSHANLTHDPEDLPMLRDQVETLIAALDASPFGLLEDYPGECYPIDVLATLGFLQQADAVLGTDHSAFFARAIRAFQPPMSDSLGLPRFRVDLPSGREVQPSRGIGTSWSLAFAPALWPEAGRDWYGRYERAFWQDRGWASGFREYERGTESEWTFEIDAGPVLDGFGTGASAFGIAGARRNGRFDHAWALATELSAASWILPGETMLLPRALSHAADAPFLGEAAILDFLTVQPAPGVAIVAPDYRVSGLVLFGLFVFFGVPLAALIQFLAKWRRFTSSRGARSPGTPGALHPEAR